jgi:Holliday junction resolvase RusA-like endonuclease
VQTPDLDNIEKAVLDALNGVAYVDDKQIFRKYTEKSWAETPEIEVWIYEMPC